jgi:hypothetical protein
MADAKTSQVGGSKKFAFSKVHKCRIHPGIGIARVGNSPDGWFIGPEAPCNPSDVTAPQGGFKDAEGRVKRQAARFRIYAYDKDGKNLGELPIGDPDDRKAGLKAKVEWTVHLKNKKGAWYKFFGQFEDKGGVRNADIPVPPNQDLDCRRELVIDPGPRCIDGLGSPCKLEGLHFDTGSFRETKVPLGELRVDEQGRLLVLGGFGRSDSTKRDNPIGADPNDTEFWADNDYWYDDVSDGPVTASVTLPNGKRLSLDKPQEASWVIVAPPKFAPGIHSIVTLYDVMREVAIDNGWVKIEKGWIVDDKEVNYFRDIYPILLRVLDTAWVNEEAQRGHGYGKPGDFRKLLSSPALASPDGSAEARERIFLRIRRPDPPGSSPKDQASADFMPPLSGDGGDRTEDEPETWLTILQFQFRKFQEWLGGTFVQGQEEAFPALEEMKPDEQVRALQRAALEPCVGGALYPGIEVSWHVTNADLYAGAFRINSKKHGPGDITKYMCLPWQADFYDCKDNWWPAARPDDVIPQKVFEEANKAWRPGQPPLSEGLEGRVKWHRGLGVSTLFRRPWHNPAEAVDDPRDSERRGCDDMVRYWSEMGFVLPRRTKNGNEIVHVEMERRLYAGMDVRELFHCLLNLDDHRDCLPKVQEFVENVLEAARGVQLTTDAFAFMDNIQPFQYDEQTFEQRMKDIYDDCADFAFTEDVDGARETYNVNSPIHNPHFRTREAVIERIRQLTPFNFLDGAWLRNIHRVGPVDEVNSILFTILKEELGDGVPSQNHANIYRDLCHSFGFYPPPIQSTAFAYDPEFLDAAFDSPVFQLGISEFSKRYYPEIIGMSLWLEWTVLELHRISAMVEKARLSSHFYRMHIAIDNAVNGHGAGIVRAAKLYLRQVRTEGGEPAVQNHWKRIWDGYVAFAYTFVIIIRQVIRIIQDPPSLQQRLEWLISRKKPYGEFNHGNHMLGNREINTWFTDPKGFLDALVRDRKIVPGKPDESEFFKLLEFRGGRMYHVFTEDEIKLWRDWTLELGEIRKRRSDAKLSALRAQLKPIDPHLARLLSDDSGDVDVEGMLRRLMALRDRLEAINPHLDEHHLKDELLLGWQQAVADYRIALWVELVSKEAPAEVKKARAGLESRLKLWLGWSMIRAVTYVAAQNWKIFEGDIFRLPDPANRENLTVAVWFDRIRRASNSAVPARAFLHALSDKLQKDDDLFAKLLDGTSPFALAFDATIPGNDGVRARDTMRLWRQEDYPLPDVAEETVKPLRLDSSLNEEEWHPTGVAIGFGTTH